MPMTLNVGLSKKMGLPSYGSLGATCSVAVELESSLLQTDVEAFHRHVRQAFQACRTAVTEELDRQRSEAASGTTAQAPERVNGSGSIPRDNVRRVTWGQRRAIEAIVQRHQLDLAELLTARFGSRELDDLSLAQASMLIDELHTLAHSGSAGSPG